MTALTKPAQHAWTFLLYDLLNYGQLVSPRGNPTLEMPQKTIQVDMRQPVIIDPKRKLSYQFMAAEAYWILSGDDSVAGIAPWNKNIAQFSDDGERFFGAYGPKILDQLNYVVEKLRSDLDSRQAGLTIWRENPPQTKDYPCTIAIWFQVRAGKLNCHVFMRSSDAWLGIPYDVFNFSMLAHLVCCELNVDGSERHHFEPGTLYLTAASSHLYEEHFESAYHCSIDRHPDASFPETPPMMHLDKRHLMSLLKELRGTSPGSPLRWWEAR